MSPDVAAARIDPTAPRRLPGGQRRLEIARVAAGLFAADGFSVSTRRISDALGITQAALYKHFKSKEELIEEVFRVRYLDDKPSDFEGILNASKGVLRDRLALAYISFFDGITETGLKLFHRASCDGLEIARRYSPHLDARNLLPVLENLRAESGQSTLALRPASSAERELAMMLHSTIVFMGIRKYVYRIDFKGTEPALIRQYVSVWLVGALGFMQDHH